MATRVVELLAAANAFSKIRRSLLQLCFVRQRLANQVPNEATNADVCPKFGNLRIQHVANGHTGIFYEALLDQANRAVEFLDLAFDDLVRNVRRLALDL